MLGSPWQTIFLENKQAQGQNIANERDGFSPSPAGQLLLYIIFYFCDINSLQYHKERQVPTHPATG